MRKAWIGAGLVLAVAALGCESHDSPLGPAPSLRAAGVVAAATGSGHITDPETGYWRTFSFSATQFADGGVHGRLHVRVHAPNGAGAKIDASITCLAIDGTSAWMAGYIEKAVNPNNVGLVLGFRVVDNGEGAGTPDLLGRTAWRVSDTPEEYCATMPTDAALFPVEAGNIQVHQ